MIETPIVTPVESQNPVSAPSSSNKLLVWFLLVIIAGIGVGFLFSKKTNFTPASTSLAGGNDIVNTTNEVGSTNATFSDHAQGTLQAGGFNGEGTHKLVRDGGPSQTVYLVSSVVDLDQYVGKKVEVWGQTLKAKRVGWLMDVGRLKLLE